MQWTDNAPTQYKNKNCFHGMSLMQKPITRNFLGEKHGKGPSDRAGACFKTYVSKIVKSKKATFSTIEDLASYCTDNYEWQVECPGHCNCEKSTKTDKIHNLHKIIYYPNLNLKGIDDMKTVDGTQKIHSVRNMGTEGVLEERMFMCCCEKCMFGVGECAFPDYSDEWKLVSVRGKRHFKSFVKSGGVGAIQKWCNAKTKSIRSQNQVSNLKRDECYPKSNVRKSARRKLSTVESDIDVSKIKSSASNTATKTTKLTASHTATKTAIMIATKEATTADGPFFLEQKRNDCDPKSNVRKSAWQKLSMVESDIDILKIKLSASNTATTADGPFILDQKCDDCDPKSNVQKFARRKLSMVESDINVSKIKSSASNTATRTTKSTASHTATKTASTIATGGQYC